jgi:hypothetical protein
MCSLWHSQLDVLYDKLGPEFILAPTSLKPVAVIIFVRITFTYSSIKLLKPTVYVMHQQDQLSTIVLYVLPALNLCVLYLSENKQRFVPLMP